MKFVLVALFSYLIGSIPFSYIIARVFFKKDIRSMGSGNPGTTNVFRNFGALAGCFCLFLDMAKGLVAVYFSMFFLGEKICFNCSCFCSFRSYIFNFFKIQGWKRSSNICWSIVCLWFESFLVSINFIFNSFFTYKNSLKSIIKCKFTCSIYFLLFSRSKCLYTNYIICSSYNYNWT